MSRLKSLGLAGARTATSRALRRLFRLPPPADDHPDEHNDSRSSSLDENKSTVTTPLPPTSTTTAETAETAETTGTAAATAVVATDATSSSAALPQEPTADKSVSEHRESVQNAPTPSQGTMAGKQIYSQEDKENQPPSDVAVADVVTSLDDLNLDDEANELSKPTSSLISRDPAVVAERAQHMGFMNQALDMARLALKINETPVGCVLVHDGKVIARGMNATNVTRNGTRHAEFMALSALFSYTPKDGPRSISLKPRRAPERDDESVSTTSTSHLAFEGNEDGKKSHLYPYGQKNHPDDRVGRDIMRESTLYVTVEPCVMCASLLRQLNIKKVYFGAVNDKFGGTGGVFSIHANSLPVREDGQTASAHPTPRPTQLPDGSGTLGTSFPPGGGDGGNVEAGYEIEGGWGRDDAVALLRRFYVQENGRAPIPRKKEGRAARLAAMMDKDGNESTTSLNADQVSGDAENQGLANYGKENVDPETLQKEGMAEEEAGVTGSGFTEMGK